MEISSGIFRLKIPIPDNPLGHLNCYLVEGSDGWWMIDTGWDSRRTFDSLEAQMKDMGLKMTDLRAMVITHGHIDHIGLARRIKEASPGTELWIHLWEAQVMRSRSVNLDGQLDEAYSLMRRHGISSPDLERMKSATMPTVGLLATGVPDRILTGGEILSTGLHDLEVIWTPGHAPGHICLYDSRKRLLFSGDHILPTISSNVGYHLNSSDDPLGDYLHSVEKIRHLPVAKVLPAHEDIFSDLAGRLDQIVDHYALRKLEALSAMAKGCTDAYTIASNISWSIKESDWDQFPPMHKQAALLETVAHLECLRWEGKVTRTIRDGNFFYGVR